jgi:hypothetical protein
MVSGRFIWTSTNAGAIVCGNHKSMLLFSVGRIQGCGPRKAVSERKARSAALHNLRREWREKPVFFIWICRNALKKLDSATEIKGNASFFFLDSFGFACISLAPIRLPVVSVATRGLSLLRAIRQALDSSPKPAASMARWVLFWKLASWPAAKRGTASAIARQAASTQPASDLAKSFRT